MSKVIFRLSYSVGAEQLTARVTMLAADRFALFIGKSGRDIARRDMTAAVWRTLHDRLCVDFCQPEWDFDSVWPLRAYAITGDYDADEFDIELALKEAA